MSEYCATLDLNYWITICHIQFFSHYNNFLKTSKYMCHFYLDMTGIVQRLLMIYKIMNISMNCLYTWVGPHAIPTIDFPLRADTNTGPSVVVLESPHIAYSRLPQLYTSPLSVKARTWTRPTASSFTRFPVKLF